MTSMIVLFGFLLSNIHFIYGAPLTENVSSSGTIEQITAVKYSSVSLKCNESLLAESNNTSVTWFHNGAPISSQNQSKLEIVNFQERDMGTYHCVMQTEEKKIEGRFREIKLKPYIDVSAADSYPLRISKTTHAQKTYFKAICFVQSYPPAKVNFYRNDERVELSDRITIHKSVANDNKDGDVIKYRLRIDNITAADIGEYYCEIDNTYVVEKVYVNSVSVEVSCDENDTYRCPFAEKCVSKFSCSSYSDCVLYFCEEPFPPRNFRVLSRDHESISLTWDRGDRVLEYLVKLKSENFPTVYLQTEENIINFKNLENDTEYLFQISALNKAGKTLYVDFHFRTKRMLPPKQVEDLEILRHETHDEVLLKWLPPFDNGMDNRQGETKYELTYCIFHKESERKEECENKFTHDTSIKVTNVKDGSLYYFKLTPLNKANQYGRPKGFFYKYDRKNKDEQKPIPSEATNFHQSSYVMVSLTMIMFVAFF